MNLGLIQTQSARPLLERLEDVVGAISRMRIVNSTRDEYEIQTMIAELLNIAGIGFEKEVKLGPRNRIDFIAADDIGIEVKRGKPNSGDVARQVSRYCDHERVKALVLVVERCAFEHITEHAGKPIRYVALNKLWGISL